MASLMIHDFYDVKRSKCKLGFAMNMHGKSSKHISPIGGLMVMNPMGSQSDEKSPKNKPKYYQTWISYKILQGGPPSSYNWSYNSYK